MSSERVGQVRASNAIEEIKQRDDDSLIHVGLYGVAPAGGSKRAVLASEFTNHHGLENGTQLTQFFDPSTGALVIVPKDDDSNEVAP